LERLLLLLLLLGLLLVLLGERVHTIQVGHRRRLSSGNIWTRTERWRSRSTGCSDRTTTLGTEFCAWLVLAAAVSIRARFQRNLRRC
jgi:hypothetical protein